MIAGSLPRVVTKLTHFHFPGYTHRESVGYCGSCWAHAAAETISSQYNIITGTTTMLSVGQNVDCTAKSYDCMGCNGGFAAQAYRYLRDLQADTKSNIPPAK